jgi:hypothetical protein
LGNPFLEQLLVAQPGPLGWFHAATVASPAHRSQGGCYGRMRLLRQSLRVSRPVRSACAVERPSGTPLS